MSEEAGEDEDDDNRTEAALAEIRSITVTRKQVVAVSFAAFILNQ